MTKYPSNVYRSTMPMRAVHIQCLDENQELIKNAFASGFIIKEKEKFILYTCWHVVTGFDKHNIEVGKTLPNRKFLRVNLQNCEEKQPGLQAIGGKQSSVIPLYDKENKPLWLQSEKDIENFSLNNIGIKVPFWNDAIMLELPSNIILSELQYIKEDDVFISSPSIGDKIFIVGYPYGYSTFGNEQPTAIVLTRFIASDKIENRNTEMLLDGPGAPGMSGGPVFLEYDGVIRLCGIYTGLIYPDYVIEKNEKTTALGTMTCLDIWRLVREEFN